MQQDNEKARSLFEEGLALCQEMSNKPFTASCLEGLASTIDKQGLLAWAAQLWGAADRPWRAIDAQVPPVLLSTYEQVLTDLKAQLGEEAFTTLWTEGQTMTLDQVLAIGDSAATG